MDKEDRFINKYTTTAIFTITIIAIIIIIVIIIIIAWRECMVAGLLLLQRQKSGCGCDNV